MAEKAGSPPSYGESQFGFPRGHGAGGYPPQGASGYTPQLPLGSYGQPGYMQTGSNRVQPTMQTVIVHQPGAAGHVIYQSRPRDYMAASIFACFCCFWPTGLCAIYFASQAKRLADEGDMAEATKMSNRARNLMIISMVIGVIWIILAIVLRVVLFSM